MLEVHWPKTEGFWKSDNTKWKREMEKALDKDSRNSGSGSGFAFNQNLPLQAYYVSSRGLRVLTSKMKEVN